LEELNINTEDIEVTRIKHELLDKIRIKETIDAQAKIHYEAIKKSKVVNKEDIAQNSNLTLLAMEFSKNPDLDLMQWQFVQASIDNTPNWQSYNPEIESYKDHIDEAIYKQNIRLLYDNKPNATLNEKTTADQVTPKPFNPDEFEKFFFDKLMDSTYFKDNQMEIIKLLDENDYKQIEVVKILDKDKSTISKDIKTIRNKVIKDFARECGVQVDPEKIKTIKKNDKRIFDNKVILLIKEKQAIETLLNSKVRPKSKEIIYLIKNNIKQDWAVDIINSLLIEDRQYFNINFIKQHNYRIIKTNKTEQVCQAIINKLKDRLNIINYYLEKSNIV